jgi:hypothetical protein
MTTSTASTIPARTVLEIRTSIATFGEVIDRLDARQRDLVNVRVDEDDYVVGFPQYALFYARLDCGRSIGGIEDARVYHDAGVAARVRVTNGAGEVAQPMSHAYAVDVALKQLNDAHTAMCGVLADLYDELVEAQRYEDHLDDCAERERVLADYRLDQRL